MGRSGNEPEAVLVVEYAGILYATVEATRGQEPLRRGFDTTECARSAVVDRQVVNLACRADLLNGADINVGSSTAWIEVGVFWELRVVPKQVGELTWELAYAREGHNEL